ncbi:MAG: hypothetical protein CL927_02160 [Deltaproteobacteria bacterium]|nr:hypothetical protein [Deltaproteobacteria bacterium]HCH63594.1 hypothetical protein [Deltaproteobacteria bacterium]
MSGTGILLMAGLALGEEIPPSVQAWSDGVASYYAHYKSVEPAWEEDSDVFPPCPQPGEEIPSAPRSSMSPVQRTLWQADAKAAAAGCAALRPGGWRLQMRLSPIDQRIFSPLVMRVSAVPDGRSAHTVVSELVDRGIWAARGYQALIPIGGYIVEINAPCGASGLFPYDLADAVLAAEAAVPEGIAKPEVIAVSACGRRAFALQQRDAVVEDGRKPREYWGFDFPERRDRARGKLSEPL